MNKINGLFQTKQEADERVKEEPAEDEAMEVESGEKKKKKKKKVLFQNFLFSIVMSEFGSCYWR